MKKQTVLPCSIRYKEKILKYKMFFRSRSRYYSEFLFDLMIEKSERDEGYYNKFMLWADNKIQTCTTYLATELSEPFRDKVGKEDLDWKNAWRGIDSASAYLG